MLSEVEETDRAPEEAYIKIDTKCVYEVVEVVFRPFFEFFESLLFFNTGHHFSKRLSAVNVIRNDFVQPVGLQNFSNEYKTMENE